MRDETVLLIDIGNTNLKWSLMKNGHIAPISSQSHKTISPEALAQSCWGTIETPDRTYMANVAGEVLGEGLSKWMWATWTQSPTILLAMHKKLGVTNGYRDPAQLGVDRWLTLLAVRANEVGPVCIVDCGTALTIDLMTDEGIHHGGMILPGLNLMRDSLLRDTKIPRVAGVEIESMFAHDTAAAVASAALHASAALIERAMLEAQSNHIGTPKLILTGSDAGAIASLLRMPYEIDSGLVMKGLALFAASEGQAE
ncbi:type III pantothenate kinase [Sedimenticola selenatireducens]|uniref:Type III pantothenate kinase n=1 Tax=Sedimenticola selenatireducens TaxID=191960 RepID=A0A557SLU1_9GAMM|nr:type III pantothenate kinase [Sedimenticola selenatireducens]TVO78320.1 type III pantothenate kinase [Sedimenticola selenatireducens]TVT62822.1 MAG: type III pantothenate kinase [Sedimenticola selenatireducens]